MLPKNCVKPLELVVSAIHCLREKKGSSPQNILRYLIGKYNVDTDALKPHVQTGLKRGISCGMITQQSGLYRLNNILSSPLRLSLINFQKKHKKVPKRNKKTKKSQLKRVVGGRGKRRFFKPAISTQQKTKRKSKKSKERRKKVGGTSRRLQNEMRKRKRSRNKGKKLRQKVNKSKKVVKTENPQTKPEPGEGQKPENPKNGETSKANINT